MADRPRRNQQLPPHQPPPQQPPPQQHPPQQQLQPAPGQQPQPQGRERGVGDIDRAALYVRTPPIMYKAGGDLELFLRRFRAYARQIQCPAQEQADLLVTLVDDKSMAGIVRLVGEQAPLDDMVAALRRSEGYTHFEQQYIAELRNRKRLRGEAIWDFYLELANLAEKAYPRNEELRNGNLRECFIANINHDYVAARLRELNELGVEALLDVAILLYGCQQTSAKPVNMIDTDHLELEDLKNKVDELTRQIRDWEQKLENNSE